MRHKFMSIWLMVCLSLILGGVVVHAQDEATRDLNIALTFIPNIQYAPFYVALEQGYFEDEGLNVTFEYLDEPTIIEAVSADRVPFGMVSGEQVILARSQERPVVFVYEWYQEYPIGIVYDTRLDVENVVDLSGLPVGIPGRFGATYIAFTTLLRDADLTEGDLRVEEIGFSAPDIFCQGIVQAATVYFNNEPLQIEARIADDNCGDVDSIAVIPVSSAADLVSNGLVTSETIIADDPALVESVVRAFDRGVRDTIANPARAYLLSAPYIENLPLDDDFRMTLEQIADERDQQLADGLSMNDAVAANDGLLDVLADDGYDLNTVTQLRVLLATIDLWLADRLGVSEMEGWESMQDALLAIDLLTTPIDLEAAFTNDYLPTVDE